jgi:anti-sigma factor RsiW
MSGTHPSEEILQQYVLDRAACEAEAIDHIGSCGECRAAIAAYGVLTEALCSQPAPEFDFDLAASVIVRVREAKMREQAAVAPVRGRKSGAIGMVIMIALFVGVPAWLFRKSAYFVFTDMSADFYWVLLAAAAIVVGFFLFRLYKKYQDVINLINK